MTSANSPEHIDTGRGLSWYVLRDLKRPNAKLPAYKQLSDEHFEVFTPMKWSLSEKGGKHERRLIPVMQDLLFVHTTKLKIEPIIQKTKTLQFRFDRGGYLKPLVVPEEDMTRFIRAVNSSDNPVYYMPGEVTSEMCGRMVRIIGGPLSGYEGNLLKIRGSRTQRLIVELPNFITAGIEVEPEYIQFIDSPSSKSDLSNAPAR